MTRLRQLWAGMQDLVPIYVIMVAIIAWNWHLQRDMFALGNLTTLLVELAPYILAAMAQTLVMLLGGVDLSVGAMISLASTLVATHLDHHTPSLLIVGGVLVVTTALATATGVFVSTFRLPAIVVTLATSFLWGGLALRILETPGGTVTSDVIQWFTGDWGPIPAIALILAAAILLWEILRNTAIGLHIYATGDNPHAARVTGVALWASYAWAFGLGGLFSGLAGIVLSAQTSSGDSHIGDPFTLSSIAAAVLGGVSFFGGEGKMAGSVAGAVVIGILVSLLVFQGVSSFWQGVVEGVILVVVVAITTWRRGAGLSGLATRARGVVQLQTEETE